MITEDDPVGVRVESNGQQDLQIEPYIYSQSVFYMNAELDPEGFVFGNEYTMVFQKPGFKDYKLSFRTYY